MISDSIYDHFKEISNAKIKSLIGTVTIIEPSFTVSQVINEISKNDAYDAFCLEKNSVLATNIRELIRGKDITDMKIRPFLYPIQSLSLSDSVQKAANIINNFRVRTVPVVNNNEIIGAVNSKNILELLTSKDNKWIKANLIFTQNPITITSDQPLSAARKLMVSKRIDHLPVVKKETVRQVLTSYHLLQALNPQENLGRKARGMSKIRNLESNIGNIGSTRVPQCTPSDNLNTIVKMMLETDATCCLVNLWEKLHGIITYRDILSLLAIKMESDIPLYIVGLSEDERYTKIITSKFNKILKRLSKVYSEIQEARVIIKRQRVRGSRQYYEVSMRITTPYRTFIQKEVGWDLGNIFAILSQRLLRQLSKRAKRRFKTSIRKIRVPGQVEAV